MKSKDFSIQFEQNDFYLWYTNVNKYFEAG